MDESAIRRDDVVVIGEDVPDALTDKLADLAIVLDGWILPRGSYLLERGLRLVGSSPVPPFEPPEIATKSDSFSMHLFDRGMEHGQQRRLIPPRRRDLGADVSATEAEREEPSKDSLAFALRQLLAVEQIHGLLYTSDAIETTQSSYRCAADVREARRTVIYYSVVVRKQRSAMTKAAARSARTSEIQGSMIGERVLGVPRD